MAATPNRAQRWVGPSALALLAAGTSQAYATSGADSAFGKSYFGSGTTNGTTPVTGAIDKFAAPSVYTGLVNSPSFPSGHTPTASPTACCWPRPCPSASRRS